MKKVLVVTYYWPPAGGPGVQRVLKFCKYFPEFGWDPVVLTVRNGEYPNLDPTLLEEAENINVYKSISFNPFLLYKILTRKKSVPTFSLDHDSTRGFSRIPQWIRLNCFIPDARKGWVPFAVRMGKKILKKENIDLIFSSGPPHSLHFIANKLKEKYGIPWIADFRDPWTDLFHLEGHNRLSMVQENDRKKEEKILSSADMITTVSSSLKNLLIQKQMSKRIEMVNNGYDENDFTEIPKKQINNDKIVISYIGGMAKSQIPESFFKAISILKNKNVNVRLRFSGNLHPDAGTIIENLGINDLVKYGGYVSHQDAIQSMVESSFVLLVIPDTANNNGIITGKLYEYLRSYTPIICIAPHNSDAANIIRDTQSGIIFDYTETNGLVDFILNPQDYPFHNIQKYNRKHLTGQLCSLFSDLVT
jgi:glycosyltransferase involved in cell wall biosynthesis